MTPHDLLIPVRSSRKRAGGFSWPETAQMVSARIEDRTGFMELAAETRRRFGGRTRVRFSADAQGSVVVLRDNSLREEGYRLTVTSKGVRIESRSDAGAYYALQTLKALLRIHGRTLPCCRIEDSPAFARRGVYFDCSRGKVPKLETLKGLVRFLAGLKVNELQLYIENVFTFAGHPQIGRGFSPFTPGDLLELQGYCERYHIRLVPSLASFGHMERILSLPGYSDLGENPGYRGLPGGTTLCPTDPRSIRLVSDLYDELLPLFKSTDFNVCCDETFGLGEGRSKAMAGKDGPGRLYLDYVLKLHRLCGKHGKRMNLWADIVLNHPTHIAELPDDVTLLNWEYDPDGPNVRHCATLRKAGIDYLACPGVHTWQAHGSRLETSMRNIRQMTAAAGKHGAAGVLNTDWGDFGHRQPLASSLHGFAYGAAQAWSGNGAKVDDATFTETFCFHVLGQDDPGMAERLKVLGSVQQKAGDSVYWAIGQSLARPAQMLRGIRKLSPVWFRDAPDSIGKADAPGCAEALEALQNLRWDSPAAPTADSFLKPVADEYELAAKLDRLALSRILLGKRLRSGGNARTGGIRELANLTRSTRDHLKRNWLLRNRPSRLQDNLRLFDNALEEMKQL